MNRNLETQWMKESSAENGDDIWFLMAEDDYLAENYYAEVAVDSPYTWKVIKGLPFGITLADGEATTPGQAKHDAEQAWKQAVANDRD